MFYVHFLEDTVTDELGELIASFINREDALMFMHGHSRAFELVVIEVIDKTHY